MGVGPDPDRFVEGSFAPGVSTGLLIVNSVAGVPFSDLHWAVRPIAAMVVAQLGTIAPGVKVNVATVTDGSFDRVKFCAQRSVDGATVYLSFEMRTEAGSGFNAGYLAPQPWYGPDYSYAWATYGSGAGDRTCQLHTAAKIACRSTTDSLGDYSDSNHLTANAVSGFPLVVASSAPSDLRVTYAAAWWTTAGTTIPTTAEFSERLGSITCRARFHVGRVGFSA